MLIISTQSPVLQIGGKWSILVIIMMFLGFLGWLKREKLYQQRPKKNDWKVERDYFNLIVIGNCFLADDQELAMSIVDSANINTCSV